MNYFSRSMCFSVVAVCLLGMAPGLVFSHQQAVTSQLDQKLREELLAMMKDDQDARLKFMEWMNKQGSSNTAALKNSSAPEMKALEAIDQKTTARMKEIVDKRGWPGKSLVGTDGAHAAWLLVQHADKDRAFQQKCLGLMQPLAAKGEVSG